MRRFVPLGQRRPVEDTPQKSTAVQVIQDGMATDDTLQEALLEAWSRVWTGAELEELAAPDEMELAVEEPTEVTSQRSVGIHVV